jgi:hypothetical protein
MTVPGDARQPADVAAEEAAKAAKIVEDVEPDTEDDE